MNISHAASASGVSAKMIRYYEETGLVPQPKRSGGGYRQYQDSDVHKLRFVGRARELGFSTKRIKELLRLWQDRKRPSREVKELAQAHLNELETQIRHMQEMQLTLRHLIDNCHGDDRPHCPILNELAGS